MVPRLFAPGSQSHIAETGLRGFAQRTKTTMQVSVTGRHVEIDGALEGHVHERLQAAVTKYFNDGIDAHVVFAREGHLIGADIAIRVGGGISHQSHAKAEQAAASFDLAAEKLEKRCGATSAGCGTTIRAGRPRRAAGPVPS